MVSRRFGICMVGNRNHHKLRTVFCAIFPFTVITSMLRTQILSVGSRMSPRQLRGLDSSSNGSTQQEHGPVSSACSCVCLSCTISSGLFRCSSWWIFGIGERLWYWSCCGRLIRKRNSRGVHLYTFAIEILSFDSCLERRRCIVFTLCVFRE